MVAMVMIESMVCQSADIYRVMLYSAEIEEDTGD